MADGAAAAGGAADRDLALAQVLGSTGCEDPAEALQALEAAGWDVDAAIAALLNSLHGAAPPHAAAGPPDAGAAAGREEGGAGHGEGARGRAAGAAGAPWYLRAPLALTLSVFRLAWAVVGAGVSLAGAGAPKQPRRFSHAPRHTRLITRSRPHTSRSRSKRPLCVYDCRCTLMPACAALVRRPGG